VSTVIIGCDTIAQLEENVQLARNLTPLSDAQMAAISQKAEPASKQALFFRFFRKILIAQLKGILSERRSADH
jgi:uncharacterized protein